MTSITKKTIYLVDGPALCYRAFFALNLSNSRGVPTGAVYGFYQTLKKIISTYQPQYMAICFDVSRKTFRQEMYKDYKIQRPPLPDGLKQQLPLMRQLIGVLGIPLIEKEGFEADDLIASFAQRAINNDMAVVIVSSDKDMYQLLANDKVSVYNVSREEIITEDGFLNEYGFPPQCIVDYLALVGDSSDNIPGAAGIGKVGAQRLVQEYGTIEKIFDNLDKVSPKMKEKLIASKDMIRLSKELVVLSFPDIKFQWDDFKTRQPDYRQLYSLFRELEFKNLLKDIPDIDTASAKVSVKEGVIESILQQEEGELFTYWQDGVVYIFCEWQQRVYKGNAQEVNGLLQRSKIKIISYDFKAQLHNGACFIVPAIWFDVKIAAYLVNSSSPDYEMSSLVLHYLGELATDILPESMPYYIYRLYTVLSAKIREAELEKLFFEVEMPLIPVLWEMERNGVKIDRSVMHALLTELEGGIDAVKKDIFTLAGKEFNLNSPQQLQDVLFGDLKILPLKKTKTGYSTGEEVLEKLAPVYPIARHMVTYRQLNKLKTTYVKPLIEQVDTSDCMLHAMFNQTATQTGRLSSSSPNLQSIPIKGDLSIFLRRAFISSFNMGYILSGDYSQIELRILAHCSDDPSLKEAFMRGEDVHAVTAALLFGIDEKSVLPDQRNVAKRVNFGIMYGMSAYGLAQELSISQQQAQQFIKDYFLRYPAVQTYIERVYQQVAKQGYVSTVMGRRRYLPDFNSADQRLHEFAQRQAVNSPIQGACADLIKVAMVKIYRQLKNHNFATRCILQIHDELVFDVPQHELMQVISLVRDTMEKSMELTVPIVVQIKYGANWADMQKV